MKAILTIDDALLYLSKRDLVPETKFSEKTNDWNAVLIVPTAGEPLHGNGPTEDEAIMAVAKRMQGRTVTLD